MISFALALIMVLVLVACGDNPASNGGNTQNETVTLRASTPTAPEHPWSKCLDNIAAQIKEKTNGRYQIDVYYNASLSENSEKTMTEQIMTGTLDLGISPAPLVGKAFSAFSFGNEFVKMIFASFLNSNIYPLKNLPTSRVCIFLETPYSKASSHFPIASH